MKKTFLILSALLITAIPMMAQNNKDTWKERKELRKMSRDALKEKASKDARKEAKALTKEDWKAAPGALPLERQLDRSYMMQQEFDDDMFPKYLMGEGMSIGENYDGAKMQALELAKQNLAGQIQTEITALVESNVANKQLSADDAATVTQTVMGAKNFISQSIGRVITVVEVYPHEEERQQGSACACGLQLGHGQGGRQESGAQGLGEQRRRPAQPARQGMGW